MNKTIESMILNAEAKMELWHEISNNQQALEDKGKTKEEAVVLANYFEGQFDALCEVRMVKLA